MPVTLCLPSTVEHVECTARPSAKRVQCRDCAKTFIDSVVFNGPVETDEKTGEKVISRILHCDHCDHLQMWREIVFADGEPTGYCLGDEPTFVRGREVQRFLARHPEAKGVQQR